MGAAVFICSISMILYIYAQLRSSLEVETYMKDLIIKMFNLEPDSIEDISCSTCGDHQFVQITLNRTSLPYPFCKRYTTKVHDSRQCCISHSIIISATLLLDPYRTSHMNRQGTTKWCDFLILLFLQVIPNPGQDELDFYLSLVLFCLYNKLAVNFLLLSVHIYRIH